MKETNYQPNQQTNQNSNYQPNQRLETLYQMVNEAHVKIQASHKQINPIVEVRQSMRASGIPADVLTIDCLRTNQRILFILHDQQPEIVRYKFMSRDSEELTGFTEIALAELTADLLFDWMQERFK